MPLLLRIAERNAELYLLTASAIVPDQIDRRDDAPPALVPGRRAPYRSDGPQAERRAISGSILPIRLLGHHGSSLSIENSVIVRSLVATINR